MQKFLHFLLVGLLFTFLLTIQLKQVYAQNSPSVLSDQAHYQPSQVIVQFEEGLSPYQLEEKVSQAQYAKRGILTNVTKILSSILETLADKPSPDEQLTDILKLEETVGVIEKSRMFDAGDESQSNTYLYTIKEGQSVENVITIFEAAPYVKYAQPNYLYSQL